MSTERGSGMSTKWKVMAWAAFVATLALFAVAPELASWATKQSSVRAEFFTLLLLAGVFLLGAVLLFTLADERWKTYGRLGPLTGYLMIIACRALAQGVGYELMWVAPLMKETGMAEPVLAHGLQAIEYVRQAFDMAMLICIVWAVLWLARWLYRGRPDVWKRVR